MAAHQRLSGLKEEQARYAMLLALSRHVPCHEDQTMVSGEAACL